MAIRRRILPQGWYPGSAAECKSDIEKFLEGFNPPDGDWVGGVAPHAGWFFSGRAAARVFATLAKSGKPDRVVVFGGHLGPSSMPVVYPEDSWETPLGEVRMDTSLADALVERGNAKAADSRFADNTVEIQIPFVRHFYPEVPMIAIHSPSSEQALKLSQAVDDLLDEKRLKAFFIGSADLTHYGPNYGFSPKGTGSEAVRWVKEENDRSVIDKAIAMDSVGVLEDARVRHNTCSAGPIASVMASAARRGKKEGALLEYYTSHDIMPGSSFVGYAAIVY